MSFLSDALERLALDAIDRSRYFQARAGEPALGSVNNPPAIRDELGRARARLIAEGFIEASRLLEELAEQKR